MGQVVGPILGTVILAAQNPAGVPVRVDSTVLAAGIDSDGIPRNILVDANGNVLSTGGVALGSTPTTQAIGDVAAAGASVKAAPELHKHGMPASVNATTQGTAAARPAAAASNTGQLYYETDTGRLKFSTGAVWVQLGINPSVLGGTLQATGDTGTFSNNTAKNISNLSQSLVPGTYNITASLTVLDGTPTGGNAFMLIWDGTNVFSVVGESLFSASGAYYAFSATVRLVIASTTTISVACRFATGSGKSVPQSPDSIGTSPTMVWTPVA